jgi:hypothetical protein
MLISIHLLSYVKDYLSVRFNLKNTKKTKSLNGSETTILELLANKPADSGLLFEEILVKAKISRPVLSKGLKYLQKLQFIIKDPERRNYKIRNEGRDYLKQTDGFMKIQYSGVPFTKSAVITFPSQANVLPIESQKTAFSNREFRMDGYLYLDQFSPAETASIIEKMQKSNPLFEWFNDFFRTLGDQIAEKKGFDRSIIRSGLEPPFVPLYQDMVKLERASLDYYASILLIFNGEEIAKKIDWKRELEKATANEEKTKEAKINFEQRLLSDEIYCKSWLKRIVLDRLIFFQAADDDSELELEKKLVKKVVEDTRYFIGAKAEIEVKKIVADLKQSGVFKIVPKYRVEIDKTRLQGSLEKPNKQI